MGFASSLTLKRYKSLPNNFFTLKTEEVAKNLLGKILVHETPRGILSGIITETEAYVGVEDKACHGYKGRQTPRVRSLYLEGGHSYVFQIYGLHYCFNVVTREVGDPQAVLIRAIQPLEGLERMIENRKGAKSAQLTNGPGKICQALEINKNHDGLRLGESSLKICYGIEMPHYETTPRIGIDYAEDWVDRPLRFLTKISMNGTSILSTDDVSL